MEMKLVSFGINDYLGCPLNGCLNDIEDVKRALSTVGFKVKDFRNRKAVKWQTLHDEIGDMMSGGKEGDILGVQYSGHGSFVPDISGDEASGVDQCWVPGDYETAGMFLDDTVDNLFRMAPKGSFPFLISDSCYSGTICRFVDFNVGAAPRLSRFMPPSMFLSEKEMSLLKEKAVKRSIFHVFAERLLYTKAPMITLSGCQDTETSLDCYFNGRPNGAFTYFLLKALKQVGIGKGTYNDLIRVMRAMLPTQEYPQTPNFTGTEAQFNWKIFGAA